MIRNTTRHQKMGWVLFILYLALLVYFLFFAEIYGRNSFADQDYRYNLIPFREVRRFWIYRSQVGYLAAFLNLAGNVIGFWPFGFFLPIVSRRSKKWYNTVIISGGFSLCVELVQLVSKVGSFDVDDIILNTAGGILGYITYRIVQRIRIWRRRHAGKK